ncbi:MAG: hypothetical protein ACK5AL_02085 [Planctomycetota bacterium]
MGWESALDRLLLQQVHAAEKGDVACEVVKSQLTTLIELAPQRPASAFLHGYATTLLRLELPAAGSDGTAHRWRRYGIVRAYDRLGDSEAIARLLGDPQALLDLLGDPQVAGHVLPIVVRSLFWSGDLKLAVRAIQYLAAEPGTPEVEAIVDAAVVDLLARLESRVDSDDQESTAAILAKVLGMAGFDRLPADVQARYRLALAERLLAASEWSAAIVEAECAERLAAGQPMLASAAGLVAALGDMRQHGVAMVEPRSDRPDRARVLARLQGAAEEPEKASPEAVYLRSLLAYETGDYRAAARGFDRAVGGLRRLEGRDVALRERARFLQAAALLAAGDASETSRALKLMEQALATVKPDLEGFYAVHEALKKHDRKLALQFLDAVDIGRGTTPDQLLFVALEYLGLGEAAPAMRAARRALDVTVDLDQRIEALRITMTAHNMLGERDEARACYAEIRESLEQRGRFEQMEKLLKTEDFVGHALDHIEIKAELAHCYDVMEGREYDCAALHVAIARSLRARRDVASLQQAYGLLQEVGATFPELAREELAAIAKLLEIHDEAPTGGGEGKDLTGAFGKLLGHAPRVLVVGGNERQRKHHHRLDQLATEWGFAAEWLMANYTSPQKTVSQIADRLRHGIDVLVLLHWNRHETTEPAHELARQTGVFARTVHYVGFTSLQVALIEIFQRLSLGGESKAKART